MPVRLTLDRKPIADPAIWKFLNDDLPGDMKDYPIQIFVLLNDPQVLRKLWNEYKPEILPRYIEKCPGRRPSLWWDFSAPQVRVSWPGVSELSEPRQKISGFCFLPWDNGKSLKPRYFKGVPVVSGVFDIYDINDPAYFESEAQYLKRHGLLSKVEAEQLNNDAFQPVSFLDVMLERRKLRLY